MSARRCGPLTYNVRRQKAPMQSFGVSFRVDREDLFPSLVSVFDALKQAKSSEDFSEAEVLEAQLSDEVRSHFYWPTEQERADGEEARANLPIRITEPSEALGGKWDLGSLLDAVENGEYNLLEIIKTSESTAELQIDPEAYPYGGIGAFMALVEAHGIAPAHRGHGYAKEALETIIA